MDQAEPIRIAFRYEASDVRAALFATPNARRMLAVAIFLMVLAPGCHTVAWLARGTPVSVEVTAATWAPILLVVLVLGVFREWMIRRSLRTNPSVHGEHQLALDEEGLLFRGALYEARMSWGAVRSVVETKRSLFFYMDAGRAILVPRRFVEDDATLGRIRELIRGKLGPRARLRSGGLERR